MKRIRVAMACVLALLVMLPAWAEVDLHASLNRDTAAVGEVVQLTVAVAGALTGVGDPRLPQLDYLNVVSTSSQKSIQFINGQMQTTTTWVYGIRASREGTYTIPAIEVPVDDRVLSTQVLTLRVLPPASASRPSPAPPPDLAPPDEPPPGTQPSVEPIQAITEVSNRTPYAGEQVTLTLRFYQAHSVMLIGNAEYSPPTTDGLISEPLPDGPQRTERLGNMSFEVATRQTALIAPAPGQYTIGPATITFRRGYMQPEESIQTDPITLDVRPLPERGRPADFGGAVGNLDLAVSLSTPRVRVGEAASLRLTISGTGDLRQIEAPEVTVDGDARVYQSGEERKIEPQQRGQEFAIGGSVTFDYLIMPREAGTLTVNPVVMHYFNPRSGRYESSQSAALSIDVAPGEMGETVIEAPGDELRYIKDNALGLHTRPPITSNVLFWLLQALPLVGLGLAYMHRAEQLRRARDPRYRRRVEAAAHARRQLSEISRMQQPAEAYRRGDEVLAEYKAARTDAAAASISPEAARQRLESVGAESELAQRAEETLRRLRAGAYAPGTQDSLQPDRIVPTVRALVDEIEAALR